MRRLRNRPTAAPGLPPRSTATNHTADAPAVLPKDYDQAAPDLVVENLVITPNQANKTANITWNTVNNGNDNASGGFRERIFVRNLTTNTVVINELVDQSDDVLISGIVSNSFNATLPTAGRFLVRITTDADDVFFEFGLGGNQAAEANTTTEAEFMIDGADLVVTVDCGNSTLDCLHRSREGRRRRG